MASVWNSTMETLSGSKFYPSSQTAMNHKKHKLDNRNESFSSLMGGSIIRLFVGPQKQQFSAHKALLCAKVPYFDKMFQGGFREASENSADFPEDDPESFDLLLTWLYFGTIRPCHGEGITPWRYPIFYALAEKLVMHILMNDIIDSVLTTYKSFDITPSISSMKLVYKYTMEGSPLRKFISWFVAYTINRQDSFYTTEEFTQAMMSNADLTLDVLDVFREHRGRVPNPFQEDNSTFHVPLPKVDT